MEHRLDEFISLPPLLVSMLSDNFVPNSGEYDALSSAANQSDGKLFLLGHKAENRKCRLNVA